MVELCPRCSTVQGLSAPGKGNLAPSATINLASPGRCGGA